MIQLHGEVLEAERRELASLRAYLERFSPLAA